jgi:phenylpropionate dioxygenase-like ring-hydroxylating dioxygenase large terminal subunit
MNAPVRLEPAAPDAALLNDWHVVAFSREVVPGAIVPATLLGEDLILWRDSAGTIYCWKDLCIHRGARLSKGWIVEDQVVCPYHGWRYDGTSKCTLIPAAPDQPPPLKARTFPHPVVERYGMVWTSLGQPAHDVPVFPEWDDPAFRKFNTGPYPYDANGYRAVENFIDATHFPFVHAGLNGVEDAPDKVEDYKVFEDETGLSTSPIRVFQPYGDHRKVPVHASYVYRCFRPLVAYFSKSVTIADPERAHLGGANDRFCTFLAAQPVDEVHTIVRLCVAINFGAELTQADIERRQDTVFGQDRAIVETQRPERIPVDLRAEIHHRTDKLGLAYRRWLGAMGLTYGTA